MKKVVNCHKCKRGEIVTDGIHTNRFCNVCHADVNKGKFDVEKWKTVKRGTKCSTA